MRKHGAVIGGHLFEIRQRGHGEALDIAVRLSLDALAFLGLVEADEAAKRL
jgi:hypothetical protein